MLLASLFLFTLLTVLASDESQWIQIDTKDLFLTVCWSGSQALGPLESKLSSYGVRGVLSCLLTSLLSLVIEEEGHVEVLRAHKSRRFER